MNQNNFIKYKTNIYEIINEEYILLNNKQKYNKEFWEMINLLLNASCFIIWINSIC